jgi:hypothetical protein
MITDPRPQAAAALQGKVPNKRSQWNALRGFRLLSAEQRHVLDSFLEISVSEHVEKK